MLYRKISALIENHLKNESDKILLIDGARQVGKTYIIRHVGKKMFPNFIELNMIEDSLGDGCFAIQKQQATFIFRSVCLPAIK